MRLIKSMTGYGRNSTVVDETRITVEVRTVNHRFLDLSIKLPKTLLYMEEKIKKLARSFFKRGRIDVFVSIEGEGLNKKKLNVDWDLLDQYMEKLQLIQERYSLEKHFTIRDIIQLQEPFSIEEQSDESNEFENQLIHTVSRAMELVSEMRLKEGESLEKDLSERAENLHRIVSMLDEHRHIVTEQYKDRIKKRIDEHLNNLAIDGDSRIIQEVAILAEKGDITEEVTRLYSHIQQFLRALEKTEPIGRRLDFIVQEMHREVNTIGAKSNDVKISEWVVLLKSEVEKLKEQSQNVE
ncbi:YicC/YloC family endoribonuclease [Salirhabdus sp. Marseille-P4669]|uniref:YicC/YloC family endoribonuclease n=1 Tax=Salirhabdus sp. Marseille-P4669 TaxID=2042310 RepID=UPI001F428BF5|nr:YicC/YloC family endoribonuclease [Salirhabdus sp. Marseille-P4669]